MGDLDGLVCMSVFMSPPPKMVLALCCEEKKEVNVMAPVWRQAFDGYLLMQTLEITLKALYGFFVLITYLRMYEAY